MGTFIVRSQNINLISIFTPGVRTKSGFLSDFSEAQLRRSDSDSLQIARVARLTPPPANERAVSGRNPGKIGRISLDPNEERLAYGGRLERNSYFENTQNQFGWAPTPIISRHSQRKGYVLRINSQNHDYRSMNRTRPSLVSRRRKAFAFLSHVVGTPGLANRILVAAKSWNGFCVKEDATIKITSSDHSTHNVVLLR